MVPAWLGATDPIKLRADRLAQFGYSAFVADMYGC
ncbi:dienelactone hydrolase family protein [Methylosoma difficile]